MFIKDKNKKIIAVLPAYNADKTLEKTLRDIAPDIIDEYILVDDESHDNTVSLAKRLGLTVIEHPKNLGYGGAQKTGYHAAIEHGAGIIIMIHPDFQYDTRLVPYMIGMIQDHNFDVMLGCRIRTRKECLEGGMPLYKYFFNRFLSLIENLFFGQNLGEYHTGFRAYSRKVLEKINWENNSDDFIFDTQFLAQCIASGFKIGEIPVPVRYFKEASSINLSRSIKYGIENLLTILKFILFKIGFPMKLFINSK